MDRPTGTALWTDVDSPSMPKRTTRHLTGFLQYLPSSTLYPERLHAKSSATGHTAAFYNPFFSISQMAKAAVRTETKGQSPSRIIQSMGSELSESHSFDFLHHQVLADESFICGLLSLLWLLISSIVHFTGIGAALIEEKIIQRSSVVLKLSHLGVFDN